MRVRWLVVGTLILGRGMLVKFLIVRVGWRLEGGKQPES